MIELFSWLVTAAAIVWWEGSAENARPELDTSYVDIVAVVTCRGVETAD